MCYSKEVQLTTGATILAFSLFYYIWFLMKYQTIRVPYDIGKTIKRAQEKNLSPNLARRLISGI